MKKPRIVPKTFPFTGEDIAAMRKAEVFLRKWMRDIDDRLFNEGYQLKDGILYEIKTGMPISSEEYRKRRKYR
jgi:hypothetical protein